MAIISRLKGFLRQFWESLLLRIVLVILVLTSLWLPMLLAYSILYKAMDKELNLTETYKALQTQRWAD